jgi:hypothetical protein
MVGICFSPKTEDVEAVEVAKRRVLSLLSFFAS